MSSHDLQDRFVHAIVEQELLAPDDGVLLAVSGGADSVAMLHLFDQLNRRDDWSLGLHVLHVNHQLRGAQADGDAAFVRDLASDLALPCIVESADARGLAEREGKTIEQAARECRYAVFNRKCRDLGLGAVALAHHADDNAETMLHRILRGTGVRGLGGIRPVRPLRAGAAIRVVRPMLRFHRSEIETYLAENGHAWQHDATNDDRAHTRNRIRHDVLPMLAEHFNPQVVDALNRLAEQACGIEDYLTETAERLLDSILIETAVGRLVLHGPMLARKPLVIQTQLIRQALLRIGAGEGALTYRHFRAVAQMTQLESGYAAIDLPGGFRAARRDDHLVLEHQGHAATRNSLPTDLYEVIEGANSLGDLGLEITMERISPSNRDIVDHIHHLADRGPIAREEWIDVDKVHPPLVARAKRPGDRFLPLGMAGMKKVSDFFTDEKIPADDRERSVVLCDQLGPIWIVPFRIDERVRLTEASRHVFRLKARPLLGNV